MPLGLCTGPVERPCSPIGHTLEQAALPGRELGPGKKASTADVEGVVAIVNKHFGRWYNQVYEPRQSTHLLDAAAQAAIQEITNLLNVMAKRG